MNIYDKIKLDEAIDRLRSLVDKPMEPGLREAIETVTNAAAFVSRLPMTCYKRDANHESDCEDSRFNIAACTAECTHPCVIQADKARMNAEAAQYSAERKLRQYREAVRPILDNCRKIIKAAESDEAEGKA